MHLYIYLYIHIYLHMHPPSSASAPPRPSTTPAHTLRFTWVPCEEPRIITCEEPRPHAWSMRAACFCLCVSPIQIQPTRVVTSANIEVPHCIGVPHRVNYKCTSHIRNRDPIGPYSTTMPRLLWRSQGGGRFLISEVPLHGLGFAGQVPAANKYPSARPHTAAFISHKVSIKSSAKVDFRTNPSTYPLLFPI